MTQPHMMFYKIYTNMSLDVFCYSYIQACLSTLAFEIAVPVKEKK